MKQIYLLLILGHLATCWLVGRAQTHGDVRLADGRYYQEVSPVMSGRVEIFFNGRWGTINYNTAFNNDIETDIGQERAVEAICMQLGFDVTVLSTTVSQRFDVGRANDSVPILLANTSCPHIMSHILRCDYQLANSLENHNDDMAVLCAHDINPGYYDTQVRLVQGGTNFTSSGFVEIYIYKMWGPVCNLGQQDANTVCRQLGYTNAAEYGSSTNYNGSDAKLDTFTCSSASFPCLTSCFSFPSSQYRASCLEFSYVNCTFDETRSNAFSAGSHDLCINSYSPPARSINWAAVIGGILGSMFLVALVASIVVLVICCLAVPSCRPGKASRNRRYQNFETESSSPPVAMSS